MKHLFIFQPGSWLGQGSVTLSASPEQLDFYTSWTVHEQAGGSILCVQQVELQGETEHLANRLIFHGIEADKFLVTLENDLVGHVEGTGVYDEHQIAWEFRDPQFFEGLEVYKRQENGEYLFHAEYVSPEFFRSTIDGKIWQKKDEG